MRDLIFRTVGLIMIPVFMCILAVAASTWITML